MTITPFCLHTSNEPKKEEMYPDSFEQGFFSIDMQFNDCIQFTRFLPGHITGGFFVNICVVCLKCSGLPRQRNVYEKSLDDLHSVRSATFVQICWIKLNKSSILTNGNNKQIFLLIFWGTWVYFVNVKFKWLNTDKFQSSDKHLTQCCKIWQNEVQDEKLDFVPHCGLFMFKERDVVLL